MSCEIPFARDRLLTSSPSVADGKTMLPRVGLPGAGGSSGLAAIATGGHCAGATLLKWTLPPPPLPPEGLGGAGRGDRLNGSRRCFICLLRPGLPFPVEFCACSSNDRVRILGGASRKDSACGDGTII